MIESENHNNVEVHLRTGPFTENNNTISFLHELAKKAIEDSPIDTLNDYYVDFTPEESHFYFLFERVLFEELINFHNSHAPENFVHPFSLMRLDPILPGLKRKVGVRQTEIRGESIAEHELRHFLKAQSVNIESQFLQFTLYKHRTKKGLMLSVGGAVDIESFRQEYDNPTFFPAFIGINVAPRFPSIPDLNDTKRWVERIKSRDWSSRGLLKQIAEQTLSHLTFTRRILFQRPLNSTEMGKLLLKLWIKERRGDIKDLDKFIPNAWDKISDVPERLKSWLSLE